MTMNPDPETFDQLRRLLVLKRYEQPPPGYFDRFPGEVIARIRESESGASLTMVQPPTPWLQRLWNALVARAVFPTAFGAAACSVLILGLMHSAVRPASAVLLTERLEGALYAADTRPMALPLIERAAPGPSTTGVLPDQPFAGILHELRAPGMPRAATLPLFSPPPAN